MRCSLPGRVTAWVYRFLHSVSSLTGASGAHLGPARPLPYRVSVPCMRVEPVPHSTDAARGQRCGTCVQHVSDQIDGDDHSRSPPQPTDRIADALHPTVLLIEQLMPPRGAVFVENPGRRVDPFALGVATTIARHY